MSLLFMDSFDHYVTADLPGKWTSAGGTGVSVSMQPTAGRRSSGACRGSGDNGNSSVAVLSKTVSPMFSDTTMITGFAVKPNATNADYPLFCIGTATGWHIGLFGTGASGLLNLRLSGLYSGTVLGACSSSLPLNVFTYVEIKILIHPSAGTIEVRFNGSPVCTLSGIQTQWPASGSGWTRVGYFAMAGICDYDDLYLLDSINLEGANNFLGDVRVDACYPSGAGSFSGWAPSAGANWSCVDEAAPNGDTDHVTAATVGLRDSYAFQDAPVVGGTIYGVQLSWNIKKLDAGTCSVRPNPRYSGVDFAGAAQNPGPTYAYQTQRYGINPFTGGAWTEAGFNAVEFGLERTA